MKSYKGQAVVLHTLKYGESGLIVSLYSRDSGRETLMLNGVRSKTKGNRAALLQPMFLIDYEASEVPHGRMYRLKDIASALPVVAEFDLRRSALSMFIAEVVYRLVKEEVANEAMYQFLAQTSHWLRVMESGVENLHLWFMVRLSVLMGFCPEDNWFEESFFDVTQGRFVVLPPMHKMYFDREQSELLCRLMNVSTVDELAAITLSRVRRREFLENMLTFIGYHNDGMGAVRSIEVLREIFG
jgi:DNA repair protein RecO (recombination protein O)